jgi:hypothetical protein
VKSGSSPRERERVVRIRPGPSRESKGGRGEEEERIERKGREEGTREGFRGM